MDIARIEQLRDELMHNRKYAAVAGVLVFAFFLVTMAGGYLLVRSAMDDSRPAASRVTNVPTKLASLLSEERGQVVNHIVFFNDVRLEPGPADDVFYAVGAAGDRMLVVSQGKKASTDADQVDIQGTIRLVPPTSTLTKKWKLDKEEVKALREQGIYIEASEIVARRRGSSKFARK
jgi:hypothetical protein